MHYELSRLDGDNIDVFHDKTEALAKAAEVLGVPSVVEGAPHIEGPGYVLTRLYASHMQRLANEADGGLLLHSFDECEDC